jgi:hypothetical protein
MSEETASSEKSSQYNTFQICGDQKHSWISPKIVDIFQNKSTLENIFGNISDHNPNDQIHLQSLVENESSLKLFDEGGVNNHSFDENESSLKLFDDGGNFEDEISNLMSTLDQSHMVDQYPIDIDFIDDDNDVIANVFESSENQINGSNFPSSSNEKHSPRIPKSNFGCLPDVLIDYENTSNLKLETKVKLPLPSNSLKDNYNNQYDFKNAISDCNASIMPRNTDSAANGKSIIDLDVDYQDVLFAQNTHSYQLHSNKDSSFIQSKKLPDPVSFTNDLSRFSNLNVKIDQCSERDHDELNNDVFMQSSELMRSGINDQLIPQPLPHISTIQMNIAMKKLNVSNSNLHSLSCILIVNFTRYSKFDKFARIKCFA